MHRQDVLLHIPLESGAIGAVNALERSFARVCPQMTAEVLPGEESLGAAVTLVRGLGSNGAPRGGIEKQFWSEKSPTPSGIAQGSHEGRR